GKKGARKAAARKGPGRGRATDGAARKPGAAAKATASGQRASQRDAVQAVKRAKEKAPARKSATQAGPRRQPVKMPAQHIAKPGHEHALDLAPRFLAPDYAGSGKLDGMAAIVTGGDSGIGRAVAVLFARGGADRKSTRLN